MPTFSNGDAYFSEAAAGWDSRSDMTCASDSALKAVLDCFPELRRRKKLGNGIIGDDSEHQHPGLSRMPDENHRSGPDVLELGCGTGLLSTRIAPYVRSVTAVDACEAMIMALDKKLAHPGSPSNISSCWALLSDSEDSRLPPMNPTRPAGPRRKFDLVLSHLVLHHIPDLSSVLSTMLACLKPGGWTLLTDFEDFGPDARRFHPESKMVGVERDGIKRDEFAKMMERVGFVDVQVQIGWVMRKEVERWPGEWGDEKPDDLIAEEMDFPFLVCIGRRPLT